MPFLRTSGNCSVGSYASFKSYGILLMGLEIEISMINEEISYMRVCIDVFNTTIQRPTSLTYWSVINCVYLYKLKHCKQGRNKMSRLWGTWNYSIFPTFFGYFSHLYMYERNNLNDFSNTIMFISHTSSHWIKTSNVFQSPPSSGRR